MSIYSFSEENPKLTPVPVKSSNSSNFSSPSSVRRTTSSNNRSVLSQNGSSILQTDTKRNQDSPLQSYSSNKNDLFKHSSLFRPTGRYSEPNPSKFVVGLRNLGNTCYMNSILQCLAHLVPFREALISYSLYKINRNSQLNGRLAEAFISLLQQMKNSNSGDVLNPGELKYQMGKFSSQFKGMEQNDSSEFFRALLEALGQDLNRLEKKANYREMTGSLNENVEIVANRWWHYSKSREDSIVHDLFQGQLVSIVLCTLCKYGSVSCDCFLSLNLPSHDSLGFSYALEECLDLYFSEQMIENYKCEKCKNCSKSRQQSFIYRFPKIMTLQVKRFKANAVSRTRLNNEIVLKETLNLSKYRHNLTNSPSLYYLKGISHHRGSLYSGHYISECKEENTWFCFDDSRVTETLTPSSSSSAYLLFYVSL